MLLPSSTTELTTPPPCQSNQDPDATIDVEYYTGEAYYYVQAADVDQE